MLTEEEKREMIQDAGRISRRDDFRRSKETLVNRYVSLDAYIQFVDDIQTINGPFTISRTPTPEYNYKL
ncbi:MAG: hypothetical protein PF503_02900 [Desulfobacula sp.]|jgi:hypothetical protein|nr:hypothetical protein [Desulfobacula sp.]